MLGGPQTLLKPPFRIVPDHEIHLNGVADPPPHPISLALIRLWTLSALLEQVAYETHVHREAALVVALLKLIRACSRAGHESTHDVRHYSDHYRFVSMESYLV
jgi:hypothetical protein